jgi:hypothetical protein
MDICFSSIIGRVMSRVVDFALCGALFLSINFATGLYAQSGPKQSDASLRSETVTTKLTAEQERGLQVLKAAEGESAGLQSDMHAFVLLWASYAYKKLDPKQAKKLSREAFTATQSIEDASENDGCAVPGSTGDMKSWIQHRIGGTAEHTRGIETIHHRHQQIQHDEIGMQPASLGNRLASVSCLSAYLKCLPGVRIGRTAPDARMYCRRRSAQFWPSCHPAGCASRTIRWSDSRVVFTVG